jgi:hypothetical protein
MLGIFPRPHEQAAAIEHPLLSPYLDQQDSVLTIVQMRKSSFDIPSDLKAKYFAIA